MVRQNLETTNLSQQSTERIRSSEFPHLPTAPKQKSRLKILFIEFGLLAIGWTYSSSTTKL
jgi:hypothetical protein